MIPSKKHSFGFAHYYCFFFSFLFSTNRFGFLKDDRASMYAFCFQALHPSKLIRSVCFRSLHNIQSCISALKLHLSFFFYPVFFFFHLSGYYNSVFFSFFFLMVEATFAGLLKKKKKPREHEGNEGSRKTRLRRGVDEASRLCERLHAASFFFFPLKGKNQLYSSAEQEEDHRHHSYSFSSPSLWFFLKKVSEEGEHS